MTMRQQWVLRRKPSAVFMEQFPDLDPILAQVLYARKIEAPEQMRGFLAADQPLADPMLLADMDKAVARLRQALDAGESIVVYGDFDVDGISATTLLTTALRSLGGEVSAYIPDRFSESYGLNKTALAKLHEQGAALVVTVDCGIRSVEEVAFARELGLDMILTDHHSVPEELPPANAVIDPKRPDSSYPFRELAGVGVAYRLAQVLITASASEGQATGGLLAEDLLDLVALGTVADIVPLIGENRVLARLGLERIRSNPRPGIRALLRVSGVKPGDTDSQSISFRLAPRLNAAGRLRHANLSYELLTAEDEARAQELAEELNLINQERQQLLERQVARAEELLLQDVSAWREETWHLMEQQVAKAQAIQGTEPEAIRQSLASGIDAAYDRLCETSLPPVLFIHDESFHEGIVGLIASRLVNEHYRPALVMRRDADQVRGSARSIEGFHITQALDACADLLARYGGHAQAAGFSLAQDKLSAFEERLRRYAEAHLQESSFQQKLDVDAIVPLADISAETPRALAAMEPFGQDNPEPSLATLGLTVQALHAVGQQGRHLRLQLADGNRIVSCIAFRQGHLVETYGPGDKVDVVYRPSLNDWNGQTTLQLNVQAIRPSN